MILLTDIAQVPRPRATSPSSRLGLLARLSAADLRERYVAAGPPADLALFEGDPECLGLVPGPLQRWAASTRSPWIGKSFRLDAPDRLVGHNRLHLLGGARALAFTGTIGASLLDGRPALILDYDFSGTTNPRWQRRLHDELRELEPGLLVGPVTWRGRSRPWTVCWFAVSAAKRP